MAIFLLFNKEIHKSDVTVAADHMDVTKFRPEDDCIKAKTVVTNNILIHANE